MDAAFPSPSDAAKLSSKPKRPFLRKKTGSLSSALKRRPSNKAPLVTPDKSSSDGTNSTRQDTIYEQNSTETQSLEPPPSISLGGSLGGGVISPDIEEGSLDDDFLEMEKMLGLGSVSSDELECDSDLIPSSLPFPTPPAAATSEPAKFVPPKLRMRQDAPKLPCEATPPKDTQALDVYEDDWGYDDEPQCEGNVAAFVDQAPDYDGHGIEDDDGVEYEDGYESDRLRSSSTNYARTSYSGRHSQNPHNNGRQHQAHTSASSTLVKSVFAPPKPPPVANVSNVSGSSFSTLPTTTVHQLKARESEADAKLAAATKMMNEARRIQASLESQSSLLREMKERTKRDCDDQRASCKKYVDAERKKIDKERGRLANERIKVSKLSASSFDGGESPPLTMMDDSDGMGSWTQKALRQEVVGLKGTVVELKRQVEAWKTKYKTERTRLNNQLQADRELHKGAINECKGLKVKMEEVTKEAEDGKLAEKKKWQSRVWRAEEEGRKWKRRCEELEGEGGGEFVLFKPDDYKKKGKGKGKKLSVATMVKEVKKDEGGKGGDEEVVHNNEEEEEEETAFAERELRRMGEIRERELEQERLREREIEMEIKAGIEEQQKVYRAEEYGGEGRGEEYGVEGRGEEYGVVGRGEEYGVVGRVPSKSSPEEVVMSKTTAPDGRVDTVYGSGRAITVYPNGTRKQTLPDGSVSVRFGNGDVKTTEADGVVVYYYNDAMTYHTSYPDGMQCYEFVKTKQVEYHFGDGRKEITYGDGTKKIIDKGGREETIFQDGVVVRRDEVGREVVTKVI
ncbi:hypothetical protein TrCOL_g5783 [Triparma columacea]|uniref:Centromere protein J C-terminal domain-containing protein n=1 Tax=Triparma columacea TaxID=722753 RepID=A0A9W7G104_9STRA|nr:hypothetical protein TrCOL_g5783 [Triparma columacea]